jgi:hypothetical protein
MAWYRAKGAGSVLRGEIRHGRRRSAVEVKRPITVGGRCRRATSGVGRVQCLPSWASTHTDLLCIGKRAYRRHTV